MSEYIVQGGDTLSAIALAKFGDASKWQAIYRLNQESIDAQYDRVRRYFRRIGANHAIQHPSDYLTPGQKLMLPPQS